MTETAGILENGVHVLPVRVYYEDTDSGGVVYYANYLKYAERGRSEMIRHLGLSNSELWRDQGIAFAVRRCEADFLRPARLDDLLEIHTRMGEMRRASLSLRQAIRRDGADLVRLDIKLACMTTDGAPARLPERVRAVLQPFFDTSQRD